MTPIEDLNRPREETCGLVFTIFVGFSSFLTDVIARVWWVGLKWYTCVTTQFRPNSTTFEPAPPPPRMLPMTEQEGLLVLSKACDIPRCGTWGCSLRDRHKGLHHFALNGKRKHTSAPVIANNNHVGAAENAVEAADATAAEELKQLKHMRQSPNTGGHPLQQVIIKVDNYNSVIVPGALIPSLRIQRKWSAEETGARAAWYKGSITHISEDDKQVFVVYDDGDKMWEQVEEIGFL